MMKDIICEMAYPSLDKTREVKNIYIKKTHNHILEIKDELLKEEHCVFSGCKRLRILNLIFEQPFTNYILDSDKRPRLICFIRFKKKQKNERLFAQFLLDVNNVKSFLSFFVYIRKRTITYTMEDFTEKLLIVGKNFCGKILFCPEAYYK